MYVLVFACFFVSTCMGVHASMINMLEEALTGQ